MSKTEIKTGYPHIDKPWKKYFKEELFKEDYPEGTIYDYIYEINKDRVDKVAIRYFGKKVTYGDLFSRVEKCAKALLASKIKKGDIVSICMLMSPEVVDLLLALNRIGAVSNFIAVNSTEEEIRKQLQLVNSSMVFVTDMFISTVSSASQNTAVKSIISVSVTASASFFIRILSRKKRNPYETYESFIKRGINTELTSNDLGADDVAVLEYTSGTTGESKACMLTNRSLNNTGYNDNRVEGLFDLHEGQTILSSIPPFLAFGLVMNIIMPLEVGLELIMIPDPSPASVAKAVVKYKPNHIVTGPTQVDAIVAMVSEKKLKMSFIKTLCVGGDKLDESWVNRINIWLKESGSSHVLTNGYGMTETSALFASATDITDFMIPIYMSNVMIIDCDSGEPLKYNEIGEICVAGPGIMKGYYKKDKENAEVFLEKDGITWLKTGDLGMIGENGSLVITGRLKRILWGMGADEIIYRIYPMAIEEVVSKCELVDRCAVIGKRNGNLGYLPILFVVPMTGCPEQELKNSVMELCKIHLKENSYPHEIVIIDKLPITKAGKIDYDKLSDEKQ